MRFVKILHVPLGKRILPSPFDDDYEAIGSKVPAVIGAKIYPADRCDWLLRLMTDRHLRDFAFVREQVPSDEQRNLIFGG